MGLELSIFLPTHPVGWDYRQEPTGPVRKDFVHKITHNTDQEKKGITCIKMKMYAHKTHKKVRSKLRAEKRDLPRVFRIPNMNYYYD